MCQRCAKNVPKCGEHVPKMCQISSKTLFFIRFIRFWGVPNMCQKCANMCPKRAKLCQRGPKFFFSRQMKFKKHINAFRKCSQTFPKYVDGGWRGRGGALGSWGWVRVRGGVGAGVGWGRCGCAGCGWVGWRVRGVLFLFPLLLFRSSLIKIKFDYPVIPFFFLYLIMLTYLVLWAYV